MSAHPTSRALIRRFATWILIRVAFLRENGKIKISNTSCRYIYGRIVDLLEYVVRIQSVFIAFFHQRRNPPVQHLEILLHRTWPCFVSLRTVSVHFVYTGEYRRHIVGRQERRIADLCRFIFREVPCCSRRHILARCCAGRRTALLLRRAERQRRHRNRH